MSIAMSLEDQRASEAIESAMLGSIVGDAIGVPVEFTSRSSLRESPVTGMRSFGTHNQPAGTWSDDSSLMLCLADSLADKAVDYHDQAARFVSWMHDSNWMPHGEVFDIGNATREAIFRLDAGVEPTEAGLASEFHCGNGSLMRILPVGLYLALAGRDERAEVTTACSRLTHGHPRCQLACVMFTEIVASLVRGRSFEEALFEGRDVLRENLASKFPKESAAFERLLSPALTDLDEADVSSSGYVIHCLEASLWCTGRAESFREGVPAAVNLGDDTDTTGAVAGALLGLRFGRDQIPNDWIESLARLSDVRALIDRFQGACLQAWRGNE